MVHPLVAKFATSLLVFGMLFTGTINTLAKKWQNDCVAEGLNYTEQNFEQPWTQTLFMYFGESLCFFPFLYLLYKQRQVEKKEMKEDYFDNFVPPDANTKSFSRIANVDEFIPDTDSMMSVNTATTDQPDPYHSPFWEKYPALKPFLFLMTSSFDLIGTTLSGIGLLYVSASIYQMLRGSVIIFSGILSVLFLKRKLYAFNWIGILTTSVGLILVGLSSILGPQPATSSTIPSGTYYVILGNVLVVLSQLASAMQFVVQETFLKKHKFEAVQVVGSEGLWGCLMMIFYVLPICFFIPGNNIGSYENAANAFYMMGQNWVLLTLILVYILSIAFYNLFGLLVAKVLTSVHRTFIDTLRTIFVWGIEVFLYYALGDNAVIGQPWTKSSWVQLLGFALLVLGTCFYNAVIKIPKLYYPTKEQQQKENQKT